MLKNVVIRAEPNAWNMASVQEGGEVKIYHNIFH